MLHYPGMVNFHQLYLLATPGGSPEGAFGFDGLGMDALLGQSVPAGMTGGDQPADKLFEHIYTTSSMQQQLIPQAYGLCEEVRARMNAEAQQLASDPWRQATLHRFFHRGVIYSGGTCGIMPDEHLVFVPGTHLEAVRYFLHAPLTVAGEKRTRLQLLRSRYPDLAALPTSSGTVPADMEHSRGRKPRRMQLFKQRVMYALFHQGDDPTPDTEHAWTRQVPWLRTTIERLVRQSALVEDGVIPREALSKAWARHLRGGFLGFTFYSFVTAELGYRALCLGEDDSTLLSACGLE